MTELKPCPFCGGEAVMLGTEQRWFNPACSNPDCGCEWTDSYATEAEAIEAWNNRAPIEYDGWFYLPKPKEGIVVYGEPEITRTENGYKVWSSADVVDEAARKWSEELGEYAMQRICEIWNTCAERTCELIHEKSGPRYDVWRFSCCGYAFAENVGEQSCNFNFCPNCGAKVVTV